MVSVHIIEDSQSLYSKPCKKVCLKKKCLCS